MSEMGDKKTFEKSLRLTKFSLLLCGINIYDKKYNIYVEYFVNNLLFYFNNLWLYTDVLAEFYWLINGITNGKSFYELSFVTPCTTICILATAKSVPIYYSREKFLKIEIKLRELYPDYEEREMKKNTNEKLGTRRNNTYGSTKIAEINGAKTFEMKIVEESTKLLNFVTFLLFYSAVAVVAVFSFMPIIIMCYHYFHYGNKIILFPFPAKYFFDHFTETRWPYVYLHQVWSTIIACVNVFGPDTFMYAFCVYIHMHFRILCHHLENLFPWSPREQTRERLFNLVRRHQELIHLVNDMESLYSQSTLFNIITSSVLICLSLFNISTHKDAGAILAFVNFLFMSVSQIFLLCYFGDMIMRSSMQVSDAVYKCDWLEADDDTKKCLLFLLTRSQKPCRLTAAGFAELNLTAFSKIISRSWSYFALLKTMYE